MPWGRWLVGNPESIKALIGLGLVAAHSLLWHTAWSSGWPFYSIESSLAWGDISKICYILFKYRGSPLWFNKWDESVEKCQQALWFFFELLEYEDLRSVRAPLHLIPLTNTELDPPICPLYSPVMLTEFYEKQQIICVSSPAGNQMHTERQLIH